MYIDSKANSKTEKYLIRCVSGKKIGTVREWKFGDNSDSVHWYKGDGNYYRVDLNEKGYGSCPFFKQYNQKTFELIWNCDWIGFEYNESAELDGYSNKYQYVTEPASGYYETNVKAYLNVTDSTFEYMWYESSYSSEGEIVTGFVKKGKRVK